MTALLATTPTPVSNPLDLVESVAVARDFAFDRPLEEELVAEMDGNWCHYRLWFTWNETMGTLTFACAFEHKIPLASRARIYPLLAAINERVWLGHFDLSSEDGTIAFRHAFLLRGALLGAEQVEDLLDLAHSECERFYPAFQSVLWGGKSADEALALSLFDTVGEA